MKNYKIREIFIMQYLHDKKRASNAEIANEYRRFIELISKIENKIIFLKNKSFFASDSLYESFYANERIMLSARALSKEKKLKIFQEAKFKRIFYEIL